MKSRLNPYLGFKNETRQAMEFYKTVFGGSLEMHTFKEYNASKDSSEDELIMHAMLQADNGIIFMGADTPAHMDYKAGTNFSMSLSGDNYDELSGYFDKLGDGGTVSMPISDSPWGDKFGMVTDKFGIQWLVNISPEQS